MNLFLRISTPIILITSTASACDLCSASLPLIRLENRRGWHVGVTEQFTSYDTLRLDGRTISDSAGQYLHSSNTQIFAGYDFSPAFGVQLNLPYIYRTFRRVEDGGIQSGSVSGIGDLSLLGHWTPVRIKRGDIQFAARITAGIKFPTGDSDRLREESEHDHSDESSGDDADHEDSHAAEPEAHSEDGHEAHDHEAHDHDAHSHDSTDESDLPPGGVHGHDLALGTGSVDGIFGLDIHAAWKQVYFDAGIQVTVRGDGAHDFDYADDIQWYGALGVIPIQSKDLNIAVEARISGDAKGEDYSNGQRLNDSSSRVVYVGPRVVCTWRDRLSVDVGVDFPVLRENSGAMVAPDYRLQAGVGWQF